MNSCTLRNGEPLDTEHRRDQQVTTYGDLL